MTEPIVLHTHISAVYLDVDQNQSKKVGSLLEDLTISENKLDSNTQFESETVNIVARDTKWLFALKYSLFLKNLSGIFRS